MKDYQASDIILFRSHIQQVPCWHYIAVPRTKRPLLKDIGTQGCDLSGWGEILASGWGENPPEDIAAKYR